jgi:hypothetical protein
VIPNKLSPARSCADTVSAVHDGTLGVMLGMAGISATGGALYGLIRGGRWWRDVKPPDPRPRSKD